jgi:hypothetical protein
VPDTAVDWARTATADQNRLAKAKTIASWCWQHGITPATITGWDQTARNRAARTAGVNPPGPGSPTWGIVDGLLHRMADWAARHPDDPRATPPATTTEGTP